MCGICAIITPYAANLSNHSPQASTPGTNATPGLSPGIDSPSSTTGSERDPTTPAASSPNLNLLQFKYEDKRPKGPDAEPPYTDIQRPTLSSRSRSRAPESRTSSQGHPAGKVLVDQESKRSGLNESFIVETDSAERAATQGKDAVKLASARNPSEIAVVEAPVEEHVSPYRKRLEGELLCSLENLAHRGPDGKGVWVSEDCRVALGHVRLSIRDLSIAGRQPMHSENDDVHIVVNGEIYMYEELKAELQTKSYTFQGSSDSELVLYLYLEYGQDFLDHLRGEFSLIVYDSSKKVVIAARDRYGIKPLFWTITPEGRILIGAEMKAFLGLGLEPEWDVKCLRDCGWLYDTRTILKGVNRIRPGHMLVIGFDGKLDSKCYWKPTYPDKNVRDTRTFDEMVLGVRERLIESIACRLRADVPVGVYLSGGIDSSVVAGIIQHLLSKGQITAGSQSSRKLKCFTIEFEAGEHNEVEIAKRTADFLGVDFRAMHADEKMLVDNFERAVWAIEQPANDLNFVGKYMLSEFVSGQGYPVVLTGEGADEHFGGYSLFLADYLTEQDKTAPGIAIDEETRKQHLARIREMATGLTGRNTFVPNPIQFDGKDKILRSVSDLQYPQLQSNGLSDSKVYAEWTNDYGQGNPILSIVEGLDGPTRSNIREKWHPLHSALYLSHRPMDGIILSSLGDRSEMGHSLEGRPPFLDPVITEYANHLPPSAKITIDQEGVVKEKWVLREASRPFISEELYSRRKHPYSAPAQYKAGGLVHDLINKHVTRSKLEMLGFVNVDYCMDLVDLAFQADGADAFRQCLMLAQFTILHETFEMKRAERVVGW